MRSRTILAVLVAAALQSPAVALAAPSLSDPALSPGSWSATNSAGVLWAQNDFGLGLVGPAEIQVNAASDGTGGGNWITRVSLAGPLLTGVRAAEFSVTDLIGRHRVRVVIDGALNSPLELGTLQLDRTPPAASSIHLTPEGGAIQADWIASDELSGIDPASTATVEVNASPAADAAGDWIAFTEQPAPGEGRRIARTTLGGLIDGRHLVRAQTRDRAGNTGMHALGVVLSDRTGPRVTEVRLVRAPRFAGMLAEVAFAADDGTGVGMGGATIRVGPVGSGDEIDWAAPGAPGPGRVMVGPPGPGTHMVTVRVFDRLGNRGESAPLAIRVPTPVEAADNTRSLAPVLGAHPGLAPGPRISWAYAQVRRFNARRGLTTRARLRVARNASQWRRAIGPARARRYSGYSTLRGQILLGPIATRGLERLGSARRARRAGPGGPLRADLDRGVLGLAVLLHESLHETGARAPDEIGVAPEFYARAVRDARFLRDRYTFLDLAADAGRPALLS